MTRPIVTEGLERSFGELQAVAGVDLEVDAGEIFGFLGPNGAGKSTTVRVLTTLLRPTGGMAQVAGFDVVKDAGQIRRRIGVALQDAAIDPLMTGVELLRLQAILHGLPKRESDRRSGDLLERVGLTAAGGRRVGTYSGGMRRRLDLALSLVHEPEILFLDEPTTGLDPTSRMALWDEVRNLNTNLGTTVFLTTQYLEEADALADRVAIIDGGRIVRQGEPSALKAKVGAPTLRVEVDDAEADLARSVMLDFGDERPARKGRIAIGLEAGTSGVSDVLVALGNRSVTVQHVELDEPSLDDVFADATGRRLEGGEAPPAP